MNARQPGWETRRFVVTGGSSGIGRAVVHGLVERGAEVLFTYARHRDEAERLVADLNSRGGKTSCIRWRLQENPEADERLFDHLESLGGVWDGWVYNAATGVIKPLEELTDRHLAYTLGANVVPAWRHWRWFRDHAPAGAGFSVVTSWGSQRPLRGYAAVGAAKGALESLVRYMAVDGAEAGIRANAVMPGVVDTRALGYFPVPEEIRRVAGKTPLGRVIHPREVAQAVVFLADPETASAVTGAVLTVDGGFQATVP